MADAGSRGSSSGRQGDRARIRQGVQIGFLLFCILLGLEFRRFVLSLEGPADRPVEPRPAAVEGFLPISSVMGFVYLLRTGEACRVHPAGLVIFCITAASVLLLRRGFCSWVCPIGTLSEYAHRAGRRFLGRNLSPPLWLDRLLRLLKYALLGFFLYAILGMSTPALGGFLQGPYNRMADVKMYLFFAHISATALGIVLVLVSLSLLVKNFWCRYLCPYGALLGLLSWLSPAGVRRDAARCTQCRRCDRACPNSIRVSGSRFVWSEECTACFSCVEACPERGALAYGSRAGRLRMRESLFAGVLILVFVLVPRAFSAMGYWQSGTPPAMYRALYGSLDRIDHPRTIRAETSSSTARSPWISDRKPLASPIGTPRPSHPWRSQERRTDPHDPENRRAEAGAAAAGRFR